MATFAALPRDITAMSNEFQNPPTSISPDLKTLLENNDKYSKALDLSPISTIVGAGYSNGFSGYDESDVQQMWTALREKCVLPAQGMPARFFYEGTAHDPTIVVVEKQDPATGTSVLEISFYNQP